MSSSAYPPEISVHEAKRLLDRSENPPLLVDVREPWETEICRIAGAELIPMRQIPERAATLPKDRPILVLCHHGGRSANVTRFLRQQGWDTAINIAGGIAAWAEEIDPQLARY